MSDTQPEPTQLAITFRNGVTIHVDVVDWTHTRNGLGQTKTFEWTTAPGGTKRLVKLDLDEVIAIVEVTQPGGEDRG